MNVLMPTTVRARLILLISISFALMVGSIVVASSVERKKTLYSAEELKLEAIYATINGALEEQATLATSMAIVVAEMPDIQEAFAAKDRERLKKLTMPLFAEYKDELNLAQFQFHLPPATSFLRLHKLDKYGDDLSSFRHTVTTVN